MKNLDLNERFFANHRFDTGIGLAEYELASRKLDGEEKSLIWTTNFLSIFASLIWFFGFRLSTELKQSQISINFAPTPSLTSAFLVFSIVFSLIALTHIVRLLKSKVFSERKIILLRRGLGVRYGGNSMILPSWRIEGADNPFSIRMFSGYLSYASAPAFFIVGFPAFSIFLLIEDAIGQDYSESLAHFLPNFPYFAALLWCTMGTLFFRLALREQNETTWLWISRWLSFIVHIPIVRNIEFQLYLSKLEISEIDRIKANLIPIVPIVISVEDKGFYSHRGISWRGIVRAGWQAIREGRRTGGSSITQQCARSNFLVRLQPAWRRKIVEVLLAKWMESILSKEEIIRIYLATSRFDYNVYGFHRACKHYFGHSSEYLDKVKAFILVERLGNVHRRFLGYRVKGLLIRLIKEGVLTAGEADLVLLEYGRLLCVGKLDKVIGLSPEKIGVQLRSEIGSH